MPELRGLLFIGDPHIATRPPGFRRDDYARTIFTKLRWCLDYAAQNALQPVLLGDLFHYPRDNANWIVGELAEMFNPAIPAVAGNHDLAENVLQEDDSLSILVRGGHVRLLDGHPWCGIISGRRIILGGTSWGQDLPKRPLDEVERGALPGIDDGREPLAFWLTHHDLRLTGYEDLGRIRCDELPGIAAVINGHIHRPLPDTVCGHTTWINPGNISRVSRGDASRERIPSVLRIDIDAAGWKRTVIPIPHQPFDEVFHPELPEEAVAIGESLFIHGLRQLETVRTASGAGLQQFLDENVEQFGPEVAAEIMKLATEVLDGDATSE